MFTRLRKVIYRYLDREVSSSLGLYRHYRNFSFDRLVIALSSVVIVAVVRIALSPLLGSDEPFLIFVVAVFVSAWFGGFRTGTLAIFLSIAASIMLFVPKNELLAHSDISLLTQLVIFASISFLMTTLITALTRTRRRTDFVNEKLKKGQQKLDQANRQIKSILESISDGFVAFDKNWCFIYVNQQLERLFGKKRHALIGNNIWDVFPELRSSMFFEKSMQAVRENRHVNFEFYSAPLNEWYLINVYPSNEGFVAYFDVITALKRREEQKDEFVSVASHELKTPVTSAKLFAGILRQQFEQKGDSATVRLIEKMDGQLDRLSKLIFTLLDVSKIHGGKLQFEKNPFPLHELVAEVIDDIACAHPTHTLTLRRSEEVCVVGDRDRVRQVLTNLIGNAVKYSPQGDRVIVRVGRHKNSARISVTDFGQGIPVEKQSGIFDRFFQADDSSRQTHSGLGLGLYISKEIVERHGGEIWFVTELGKGTTFFFTLPLKTP